MNNPPSPPQPLTFLDALRLAKGCHDYSGGYGGTPCAEAFHAGIGTVVNVLSDAASGKWDYQLQAVYDEGAEPQLPPNGEIKNPMPDTSQDQPLWQMMNHAYAAHDSCRKGYAAEIRAIADWLVPEDHGCILEPLAQSGEYHRWCERMVIRQRLLAEADRAERGEA
jgi:hypothetical protein